MFEHLHWEKATDDELVAALWCAGPVPREAIAETESRLRAILTLSDRLSIAEAVMKDYDSDHGLGQRLMDNYRQRVEESEVEARGQAMEP